jgi:hypothetical protein
VNYPFAACGLNATLAARFQVFIYFHARFRKYLDFAQAGGFHMQGTSVRDDSQLCLALNNAADGSLRLARRVKIDES